MHLDEAKEDKEVSKRVRVPLWRTGLAAPINTTIQKHQAWAPGRSRWKEKDCFTHALLPIFPS